MTDDQARTDLEHLNQQPQFRRFLWRVIQLAGILQPATNGSDTRNLAYAEGRRNLGFDILHEVEQAQPAPVEDSLTTIFLSLREAAQSQEKPNARKKLSPRYDRNEELADGDDQP